MRALRLQFGLKKLHAHMFRHSFATIMINRGADLISLMNIMGHKNLETTQRYLHANKEHTKKMYFNSFNLDN
jgi:site-specific recombinase XerD